MSCIVSHKPNNPPTTQWSASAQAPVLAHAPAPPTPALASNLGPTHQSRIAGREFATARAAQAATCAWPSSTTPSARIGTISKHFARRSQQTRSAISSMFLACDPNVLRQRARVCTGVMCAPCHQPISSNAAAIGILLLFCHGAAVCCCWQLPASNQRCRALPCTRILSRGKNPARIRHHPANHLHRTSAHG